MCNFKRAIKDCKFWDIWHDKRLNQIVIIKTEKWKPTFPYYRLKLKNKWDKTTKRYYHNSGKTEKF